MDKIKLLTFAVIALLLLNLGTLGFLIFARPPHPMGGPGMRQQPKEIIIERLHFDEAQQQKYAQLIRWHRGTINEIEKEIYQAKNKLYLQLLKTNADTISRDSLINALGNYQKQIEATHFRHFQDIKNICRPDQMEDYNDLTAELSRIFSKPPNPGHD
jgi:DNA-binding XRE family transcriptional regulator